MQSCSIFKKKKCPRTIIPDVGQGRGLIETPLICQRYRFIEIKLNVAELLDRGRAPFSSYGIHSVCSKVTKEKVVASELKDPI